MKLFAASACAVLAVLAQPAAAPKKAAPATRRPAPLSAVETALVKRVSANALRAHVSFLASDALEGRDTPSKGLDVAAEYIAAHFRRFGLDPAGDDGYFQTAPFGLVTPAKQGLEFTFTSPSQSFSLPAGQLTPDTLEAVRLAAAPVVKVTLGAGAPLEPGPLRDKVVFAATPRLAGLSDADRPKALGALSRDRGILRSAGPALVVTASERGIGGPPAGRAALRDLSGSTPPQLSASDAAFARFLSALPDGPVEGTVSAVLPAPAIEKVKLRNVAGLLRGSDPKLRDTFILITAHYDHIGVRSSGDGDRINNGANDDASGTAGLMDLAEAFAAAKAKPKRSLLFVAYFGEEKGLLGSRYYGAHPLVPLARTIANLNLEHTGRTDDTEGPQMGRVAVTGMDYSSVAAVLKRAGERTGVTFWRHEKNSDAFFGRSDNQALADLGVPAHTLSTAYIFPDYHRPGDHWDKIDYANMETITRSIALGVWLLANDPQPPRWNSDNPKAQRYVEAARRLDAAGRPAATAAKTPTAR